MMSQVEIQFVGILNKQERYSGDGLELVMGDVVKIDIVKAHQVLQDHPNWFKPISCTLEEIEEFYAAYQDSIQPAEASKGFRMVDNQGKSMAFPPGSKITIEIPDEASSKRTFPVQHRCEIEGCGIVTKKGQEYCKKHLKEKEHAEA